MPPTKRSKQLGRLVRQHRQAKGLSLRVAAKELGYDHSYLGRIEAGDYPSPAPQLLKKLARLFEIPIEDLYALAGYQVEERLPAFAPYLRAKYDLPDEMVERLDEYFQMLKERYGADVEGGGRDG